MLSSTVPRETTAAGTNTDSAGRNKDNLNVSGWKWKRKEMHTILTMNKKILNRKKMSPMAVRPWKRKGTAELQRISTGSF